jgi:hypothetical protein
MMPNKTIYVKDSDMPLFEQAQEQLGDSISGLFAEFLRERVGKLTPDERRILNHVQLIAQRREEARKQSHLPAFIDGEYAEAERHAQNAHTSFQQNDIRKAKIHFYAANAYYERAERDRKDTGDLAEKIAALLKNG